MEMKHIYMYIPPFAANQVFDSFTQSINALGIDPNSAPIFPPRVNDIQNKHTLQAIKNKLPFFLFITDDV